MKVYGDGEEVRHICDWPGCRFPSEIASYGGGDGLSGPPLKRRCWDHYHAESDIAEKKKLVIAGIRIASELGFPDCSEADACEWEEVYAMRALKPILAAEEEERVAGRLARDANMLAFQRSQEP